MGAVICEHAPFIARLLDERIRVSPPLLCTSGVLKLNYDADFVDR